ATSDFFFQAEDGIRDFHVTGVQTCALPISTKPWDYLCQSAIKWAEEGHTVNSFEHLVIAQTVDFYLYTQSGRDHFLPDGFLPQRSEERRVGKECGSRWWRDREQKINKDKAG